MIPPRIAVSGITLTADGLERSAINAAYIRAVVGAGGLPLILSPLLGTSSAGPALDVADALLLTGGDDIDPATYGAARHPGLGPTDPLRDAFELALFRQARDRGMPTLAICRGLQLVNVGLGGELWQDLPTERPGPLVHRQSGLRSERTHQVSIEPGTQLARVLGVTACAVNSLHHQGVRQVAPGLTVSARAPDGTVEGLERTDDGRWLLAVQWHPEEFHGETDAPDRALFLALVKQATAYREQAVAR